MRLMLAVRKVPSKCKFKKSDIAEAMRLRLQGTPLAEISAITGIGPSYISKLFNATEDCMGWRYRELPGKLRLQILRRAIQKHEKHIDRLKSEVVLLELQSATTQPETLTARIP